MPIAIANTRCPRGPITKKTPSRYVYREEDDFYDDVGAPCFTVEVPAKSATEAVKFIEAEVARAMHGKTSMRHTVPGFVVPEWSCRRSRISPDMFELSLWLFEGHEGVFQDFLDTSNMRVIAWKVYWEADLVAKYGENARFDHALRAERMHESDKTQKLIYFWPGLPGDLPGDGKYLYVV